MGLRIEVNPAGCVSNLCCAVDGHIANLKNILRAVEDGSFRERAQIQTPGSLLHYQVGDYSASPTEAAERALRTCFADIVSEVISFLDRMVATRRTVLQGAPTLNREFSNADELKSHLREQLEDAYRVVARDTSLRNAQKLEELKLRQPAAEVLRSFFAVRRCIEHHGSMPDEDITLRFKRFAVIANAEEIVQLPQYVDGEVTIKSIDVSKALPKGAKISFTELDIDNVGITVQILADAILRTVTEDLVNTTSSPPRKS